MFLVRATIVAFLLVSLGGSCPSGTPHSENPAVAPDRAKANTASSDPAETAKLAKRYHSVALGHIVVSHNPGATVFDFGERRSEMGSRKNPDGTVSFITT